MFSGSKIENEKKPLSAPPSLPFFGSPLFCCCALPWVAAHAKGLGHRHHNRLYNVFQALNRTTHVTIQRLE
jgi:hypothetical protein